MKKLIKLSEEHYVIVDESEIKKGDWVIELLNKVIFLLKESGIDYHNTTFKKITHSFGKKIQGIENIPISEVEELLYGYSAQKFAEKEFPMLDENLQLLGHRYTYIKAFNKHKELVKEKLFTVEDMRKAIQLARRQFDEEGYTVSDTYSSEIIQSLLPKTEWEVEFDELGKLKLV